MKREEAIDKFAQTCDPVNHLYILVDKLYKEGYIILTPNELKKVNTAIVLADVHGMNPFKPKKE